MHADSKVAGMKRTASPIESPRKEKRRQDPVSCSLCRSKKLKCSREAPCSNCRSRGLECDLKAANVLSVSAHKLGSNPAEQRLTNDALLVDVLARLQRLERAVLDGTPSETNFATGRSTNSNRAVSSHIPQYGRNTTLDRSVSPQYGADPTSDQTFAAVESTTTRDDAMDLAFADTLEFSIKPALDIHRDVMSASKETSITTNKVNLLRQVLLPTKEEALSLYDDYINSVGALYHILHFPTTRRLIESMYTRLAVDQEKVSHAHIALVLAIVATGAYFWTPASAALKPTFHSTTQSEHCSMLWTKWTMDVLENNRRTVFPTVEDLQATILICHLITNIEGFTARTRFLYSTSLNMARDMGLHLIDSPRNRLKGANSDDGFIALEVKRRLWWYCAASDWLMCNIPGPQEGFHSIQPNQFCVNKPLNIWDDDLTDDAEPVNLPLSQPTHMSYNIVRCIAGDLARRIVDAKPPPSSSTSLVSGADFVALESHARERFSSLPSYFRFDMVNDPEVRALHARYPSLTGQRAIVTLGINLGILHLHRPYLFQRAPSPVFSDSRKACLHAARQIIDNRRSMDDIPSNLARTKITFVVHHVFMAVIVLALDLCFNSFSSEADREAQRLEVKSACELLDDRRNGGTVAARYLAPLLDTLRKHRVQLGERDPEKTHPDLAKAGADSVTNGSDSQRGMTGFPATSDVFAQAGSGMADAMPQNWSDVSGMGAMNGTAGSMLWQDILDFQPLEVTPDWEQLFADLDATYAF